MTIFDLLFLASFLVSVITLIAAAYAAIRGRCPRAFSILGVWLVCVVVYLGISVAVAYAAPQRVIAVGTPWCFDDWCLTVENVQHAGRELHRGPVDFERGETRHPARQRRLDLRAR